MRITDTHIYFFSVADVFSNFYPAPFLYRKKVNDILTGEITQEYLFNNSEQAYMFEKCMFFNQLELAEKCINEIDPKKVKNIGRSIPNFDAEKWDKISFGVMYNVCLHKYTFNKEAHKTLVDSGDRTLVEASPYDNKWGVGISASDDQILFEENWTGENRLGKVLMKTREKL